MSGSVKALSASAPIPAVHVRYMGRVIVAGLVNNFITQFWAQE
jgi:hypothetical protein